LLGGRKQAGVTVFADACVSVAKAAEQVSMCEPE
jgi:hypothetical protein